MEAMQPQKYDEWLVAHRDELMTQYPGKVVAIREGKVILTGDSLTNVYRQIMAAGLKTTPLILRIPLEGDRQPILYLDGKTMTRVAIGFLLYFLVFVLLLLLFAGAGYAWLWAAIFFLPQAWRLSRKAFNWLLGGVQYAKLREAEIKPHQALGFALGGFAFVAAAAAAFFPLYSLVFGVLAVILLAGCIATAVY